MNEDTPVAKILEARGCCSNFHLYFHGCWLRSSSALIVGGLERVWAMAFHAVEDKN